MIVRESLNFERKPLTPESIGVGIFRDRQFETFPSFIKFLSENVCSILNLKELPEDFITRSKKEPYQYEMRKDFNQRLFDYIQKHIKIKLSNSQGTFYSPPPFYVKALAKRLIKHGIFIPKTKAELKV